MNTLIHYVNTKLKKSHSPRTCCEVSTFRKHTPRTHGRGDKMIYKRFHHYSRSYQWLSFRTPAYRHSYSIGTREKSKYTELNHYANPYYRCNPITNAKK